MIIKTNAFARVGLIGNPSDGYFGKTISVICRNYAAKVTCYESPRLIIHPQRSDRSEFDDLDDLVGDVKANGYYGGIRLIKAAIKRFHDYCEGHGFQLDKRNFTIEYDTDIPVRVGLAGSSAIVTAAIHALLNFYGVEIGKPFLPNLALSVELDELGIGAGLQDRVIQVYEGAVYMDFDRQTMEARGHGKYESLDPAKLPPLFVAYQSVLAEGTEVPHNDLRARFNRGEQKVLDAIDQFASYAEQARDLIIADRGAEIGPLMDQNFDLRAQIMHISEGNRCLVETGRKQGASVKFAGSGGAVIGCYDGDPKRLEAIVEAYRKIGAEVFIPQVLPV
jgi:glucuronokinase